MKRSLVLAVAMTFATAALAQSPKKPAPPAAAGASQQVRADVQTILACIDKKSPEGELPPEGPARDKIMQEAEGGPQACAGLVIEACQTAGGQEEACLTREANAWLASTALDAETEKRIGPKNATIYKAASTKIMGNAIALCKAAAAVSAWGAEAIKADSKDLVFDVTQPCVFDAIVQQSLVILVNRRGS